MTARKIEIPDELWGRTRVRAFETNTTAAALVTQALEALLAKPPAKSSDGAPRSARPPKPPTDKEPGDFSGHVAFPADPTAGDFVLEHAADGQQIITPLKEAPVPKAIITTPEEAARVAATIAPIHPVPKPSSKTKPRR